jgi:hypothetical protein
VQDCLASVECTLDGRGIGHLADARLDTRHSERGERSGHPAGRSRKYSDAVTGLRQCRDRVGAYVAGSSGDEQKHLCQGEPVVGTAY